MNTSLSNQHLVSRKQRLKCTKTTMQLKHYYCIIVSFMQSILSVQPYF